MNPEVYVDAATRVYKQNKKITEDQYNLVCVLWWCDYYSHEHDQDAKSGSWLWVNYDHIHPHLQRSMSWRRMRENIHALMTAGMLLYRTRYNHRINKNQVQVRFLNEISREIEFAFRTGGHLTDNGKEGRVYPHPNLPDVIEATANMVPSQERYLILPEASPMMRISPAGVTSSLFDFMPRAPEARKPSRTFLIEGPQVRLGAGGFIGEAKDVSQVHDFLDQWNYSYDAKLTDESNGILREYQIEMVFGYLPPYRDTATSCYNWLAEFFLHRYATDEHPGKYTFSKTRAEWLNSRGGNELRGASEKYLLEKVNGNATRMWGSNNFLVDLVISHCWPIIEDKRSMPYPSQHSKYWRAGKLAHNIIAQSLQLGIDIVTLAKRVKSKCPRCTWWEFATIANSRPKLWTSLTGAKDICMVLSQPWLSEDGALHVPSGDEVKMLYVEQTLLPLLEFHNRIQADLKNMLDEYLTNGGILTSRMRKKFSKEFIEGLRQ